MHVKVRPYIWESANRPMFVRSVWLDNEGHRHVILDEETSKKRSVKTMRRVQTERAASSDDQNEDIFHYEKLHDMGINGREIYPQGLEVAATHLDVDPMCNKSTAKKLERSMGKLRACKKMCEKNNMNFVTLKHDITRQKSNKGRIETETSKNVVNEKQEILNVKTDETHKNQLTERVLQWLDKTGKFTSMIPAKKEKLTALPEINVKGNEIEQELEIEENFQFVKKVMSSENILKPRLKTAIPLRRSESVHTLSLTFNDDEVAPNPYGLSRCRSASLKFGEFFPTTYKCSRKFLQLCSRKNSASSSAQSLNHQNSSTPPLNSATNLNETPETSNGLTTNSIVISLNNLDLNTLEENNGMTGNRNNQNNNAGMEINNTSNTSGVSNSRRRKILRRKDTLIENQYKHIIHKHILETQCNTQIVKRQLHIFIPKLPKKDKEKKLETSNDSNQVEAPFKDIELDSCLSTIQSEMN